MEDPRWSAKERMIIARTKQYLGGSYSVKVEVEELEGLLGPDEVNLGRSKRRKRVRNIYDPQHRWSK